MNTSLDIKRFSLPLARPIRMAWGTLRMREGAMVYLHRQGQRVACAECSPLPGYSDESLEMSVEALQALDGAALEELLEVGMNPEHLPENLPASASFALQTLALTNRLESGNAPALWSAIVPRRKVALQAVVTTPQDARVAVNRGYRTLKVKVGADEPSRDIDRVRSIRNALPADIALRLDANRAWDFDTALHVLSALYSCELDFIEEPLRGAMPSQLRALQERSAVRVAVDESIRKYCDIEAHLEAEGVRIFVLKPAMLGGPITTLALARLIESEGGQVVISNLFEGPIGVAVNAAVAARCRPGTHGLGTADLFANPELFPPVDWGRLVTPDLLEVCT